MIQDIAPHILQNQYQNIRPAEQDPVFCFRNESILLQTEGNHISFPLLEQMNVNKEKLIYLFSLDSKPLFLCLEEAGADGFAYVSFNEIRRQNLQPEETVYAIFTAYHLAAWYTTSRYCGKCGHETVHDEKERAMRCPACGNLIYPRINPAVIVGVLNKDRILITRYARGYGGNALIAGFTEIGETFEETVAREVMEEAGINVKNIRYYKSQPWGPASDILAGYYCDVDGDDTITVDYNELRTAEWIKREDVVLQSNDYSLTNEMMKMFKEGKI